MYRISILFGMLKAIIIKALHRNVKFSSLPKINVSDSLIIRKGGTLHFGKKFFSRGRLRLYVAEKATLDIGNFVFFNVGGSINCMNRISIGNDVIFGENVKIYDHNHAFNDRNSLIREQGYSMGYIEIGNNVWIGSNVVILKNTKIGNNCVIGAGCVISGNIPDFSLVRNANTFKIETIQ